MQQNNNEKKKRRRLSGLWGFEAISVSSRLPAGLERERMRARVVAADLRQRSMSVQQARRRLASMSTRRRALMSARRQRAKAKAVKNLPGRRRMQSDGQRQAAIRTYASDAAKIVDFSVM